MPDAHSFLCTWSFLSFGLYKSVPPPQIPSGNASHNQLCVLQTECLLGYHRESVAPSLSPAAQDILCGVPNLPFWADLLLSLLTHWELLEGGGQLSLPLCSNAQQHLAPGEILDRQESGFLGGVTLHGQLIIGDINLASRRLRPNEGSTNYSRFYSTKTGTRGSWLIYGFGSDSSEQHPGVKQGCLEAPGAQALQLLTP